MALPIAKRYDDFLWLLDEYRNRGTHCVGGIGAGKSRLLGRQLAFSDFIREVPTIVIDNGYTIDNFLHRVGMLPREKRMAAWKRIRYVDLAGGDYVVPFPFFYRLGNESPLDVSQRFIDLIEKLNPELEQNPRVGLNAIRKAVWKAGRVLVENNWQVTELPKILGKDMPESLEVKILPYILDEMHQATYAATSPGIDWHKVVENKEIVLLDYRNVTHPRLILLWLLDVVLTFIRHRGIEQEPISLIIDELSTFKTAQAVSEHSFFNFLNTLLTDIMRHYNIWLTLGHQDMNQFLLKETQQLLIDMGTQIIGRTDNVDAAWGLAKQFTRVDTKKVKDIRVQYGNDPYYAHITDNLPTPRYFALDEQALYFTPYEQILENSYQFVDDLPDLTFTVKMPKSPLQTVSLRDIERGVFIQDEDKPILAAIRDMLMKRDARKTSDVLAEIAARTAQPSQQLPAAASQSSVIPVTTKGKFKRP